MPTNRQEPCKHIVRVKRCNRWDVSQKTQEVQTFEVTINPRAFDESHWEWIRRATVALCSHHPQWSVSSSLVLACDKV